MPKFSTSTGHNFQGVSDIFYSVNEKPIKINSFSDFPGNGWESKFVYRYLLLFLGRKGKHINKIPWKSQENARTCPGQSLDRSWDNPMENLFMCFLVYWFCPALNFCQYWFYRCCALMSSGKNSPPIASGCARGSDSGFGFLQTI